MLTQRLCVLLCNLITCYYVVDSAWFQRLKLKCDELLSSFAFKFNLRRYTTGVIEETSGFYKDLMSGKTPNAGGLSLK